MTYWMILPALLATLIGSAPAAAEDNEGAIFELCATGSRAACVVDGDTIWYHRRNIRLLDIDAPEMHDFKCDAELALAQKATARLLDLLNTGPFEIEQKTRRLHDSYGRQLRRIRRDGVSLGDILIDEKLAVRWRGHHQDWCRGQ